MPKTEIDYANTIIYKISCKDTTITDVYVGHTTNFTQRKHMHKLACKSIKQNGKLYEVIRANGGWGNWEMAIINYYNFADRSEARKKEQEYITALKASLNHSGHLHPKKNVILLFFPCNTCNLKFNTIAELELHKATSKHKKISQQSLIKTPKNATVFNCEKCDFTCCKESDYARHIVTRKHKEANAGGAVNANAKLCDICNHHFKHASSLSRHKKKCSKEVLNADEADEEKGLVKILIKENMDFKNIILELVKNNGDLQKQMVEVCKTNTATNIHNSHSHNKTFNMQVFLNEQCKDAMNIMDFVNSMTLELSDLEDVGEVGYVEGISKIIIRKLNELDVCKRPIHCSDFKREIMYVKDMDIWSKENSTFDKIRKAIKYVTKKNGDLLIPWIQKYPTAMNIQHPHNDIYMRIMNQAMGGRESFVESENKIIKKISKAVQIDKHSLNK